MMKMITKHRQTILPRLFHSQVGFSLVELMVATVIIVVTLAGVTAGLQNFNRHNGTSLRENEKNTVVKATFQLLKRDLNMAGFGLALQTRLAEDDQYETAIESDFTSDYDFNNDSDSLDDITEANLDYDLNNDGDKTDPMYRDRLYLANGWSILEDVTDNNSADGNIVESPTDYYYLVASQKEKGGYFAKLTAPVTAGALSVTVDNLNINMGEEVTIATDFKSDAAIIICGASSTGTFSLEGLSTGNITGSTIHFQGAEALAGSYVTTGSAMDTEVVPAIVWYVEQKSAATPADTVPWLYRNDDKVMPGVIGFQVSYGYDADNDGLDWFQTVPPTGVSTAGGNSVDSLAVNINANLPALVRDLKAVRLVITIKEHGTGSSIPSMQTYEKTILLKN